MASLTRWTWILVNSGSWWWTGRPGVLRFMGSQRVRHDWVIDLIWSDLMIPLPFTLLFCVRVYTPFLCFLSREDPLAFVGELVWWCWFLSAFVCFVKLLIYSLYLIKIIARYSNLGCRLFSFVTFRMSCCSLLAWKVSIERSAVILMGIPLCVNFCFSLDAFNICFFCVWSLLIWLICVLWCFPLGLSCFGLSEFLGLGWLFPSPF